MHGATLWVFMPVSKKHSDGNYLCACLKDGTRTSLLSSGFQIADSPVPKTWGISVNSQDVFAEFKVENFNRVFVP